MKSILAVALALASVHAAQAADGPAEPASAAAASLPPADAVPVAMPTIANGDFCLYANTPPSDYKYQGLGRVKLGKGSYGGVRDELPAFVERARAEGADAITNYNGAQRFGFWPWRLVRPVLTGTAIKWTGDHAPDCAASGGATLATVMSTNKEPPRR